MIDKIKDSLFFIYKFCKANNMPLEDYPGHKTNIVNSFILHIQENEIVIYVMFGFEQFERELSKISYDVREFILGEQMSKIDELRRKYYTSKRAKPVICKGIDKLRQLQKKA